jgi:hypothetical protein
MKIMALIQLFLTALKAVLDYKKKLDETIKENELQERNENDAVEIKEAFKNEDPKKLGNIFRRSK